MHRAWPPGSAMRRRASSGACSPTASTPRRRPNARWRPLSRPWPRWSVRNPSPHWRATCGAKGHPSAATSANGARRCPTSSPTARRCPANPIWPTAPDWTGWSIAPRVPRMRPIRSRRSTHWRRKRQNTAPGPAPRHRRAGQRLAGGVDLARPSGRRASKHATAATALPQRAMHLPKATAKPRSSGATVISVRVEAIDREGADFTRALLGGASLAAALDAAGEGFAFDQWLVRALQSRRIVTRSNDGDGMNLQVRSGSGPTRHRRSSSAPSPWRKSLRGCMWRRSSSCRA